MIIRRFTAYCLAIALFAVLTMPAFAGRGTPPPPPPDPVEINSICYERVGPGGANWKPNGSCTVAYATIVFDGVTEYDFCFITGPGQNTLRHAGSNGCPSNSVPVTLTGDGSVAVTIGAYNVLLAPWVSGTAGVI